MTENSSPSTQGRNGGIFWLDDCPCAFHMDTRRQDHFHRLIRAWKPLCLSCPPRWADHHRCRIKLKCGARSLIACVLTAKQAEVFYLILTACSAVGWLVLLFIKRLHAATPSKACPTKQYCTSKQNYHHSQQSSLVSQREFSSTAFVKGTFRLFFTREMLIFLPFLFYTGLFCV